MLSIIAGVIATTTIIRIHGELLRGFCPCAGYCTSQVVARRPLSMAHHISLGASIYNILKGYKAGGSWLLLYQAHRQAPLLFDSIEQFALPVKGAPESTNVSVNVDNENETKLY